MPIYEYECPEHGLFEELRPMRLSAARALCPACRVSAPRVLSVTRTGILPRAASLAHARNEKSQHSPGVCQHSPRAATPKAQSSKPRVYRGKRPWVIEHG